MVYPIRRQRGPQPYRDNIFQHQHPDRTPPATRGKSANKSLQPIVKKGVDGVSKTLGNVQQVLGVVQSTTPIIQQYGPMVRNIPAMYRMFKAFKDVESSDHEAPEKNTRNIDTTNKESSPVSRRKNMNTGGESTPKLFF